MLRTRIILIIVSSAVIALLFLLPKAVVENDSQLESGAAPDSIQKKKADPHNTSTREIALKINNLKARYLSGSRNEKNVIFADSLASLYREAGKFDSAAWFADEAATFFNTTEAFLKAGNNYYDAFTFAMEAEKQKALAEKTRSFFGKVLEAEPKNLEVKTKMAMTYISSSSPMQGIMMLREVLKEDPENELALFNMGMLSIQSRQFDRAIERLEQLIVVNPKHIQGQLLLGVAYMNDGDKAKAKAQFEKVKQLDSDPSVQATADSYLNDLK
jgi:outer membrane protein